MSNLGIWIQELPQLCVMAFHSVGGDSESVALQLMQDWFVQQQLPDGYLPRIFGYTKPLQGQPGYEVLIVLPPGGSYTPAVSVRAIEPCAYACVTSPKPEWDFVKQHIAQGPYHIRQGNQWAPTTAYGGILQRQWLIEYHPNADELQACMNTGIVTPTYHHYTILIPIGRRA